MIFYLYKILNTNQSYSMQLTTYLFVTYLYFQHQSILNKTSNTVVLNLELTRVNRCTLDLLRLRDIKVRLISVLDKEVALLYPAENKIWRRADGVLYLKLL